MGRSSGPGRSGSAVLFLLAFWALHTVLSAPPAYAPVPQEVTKPIQHEVSVVLKLVHASVTDKKGGPISDLDIGDFMVTDNGRPVTLTAFERRALGTVPKAPGTGEPPAPAGEKAAPDASIAAAARRKFFLFFDFVYNNGRGVAKAQEAASHFLDANVAPEDEVALLSYSLIKGLAVHEYLTTDHAKVRRALGSIGGKEVVGRAEEIEERYWDEAEAGLRQGRGSISSDGQLAAVLAETGSLRAETEQVARNYALAMTALAKALRIVPGQKQFIFFSTGLPGSLLFGNRMLLMETGDPLLRSQAEEMNREFGASGCVFYVLDTRAAPTRTSLYNRDIQTFGTRFGRGIIGSQDPYSNSNDMFKSDNITGLTPLQTLARKTGGLYFSNIDAYEKNLDRVQAVTGTFYVLGYPVQEEWDGRFHQVKVEVKRKGCEVRTPGGYFSPKPFGEYTGLEKQLHLFDLALNERAFSRIPVDVPMTALTTAAEGITRLAVLARVPGEVLAKFSGKRVEFVAVFFDEKWEIADLVRAESDLAQLRGRDLAFGAGATVRPGDFACRLVIRDMDTGQAAVASSGATIGKPAAMRIQLGTPLILEPKDDCSFLSPSARKAREAFPWPDIYPFDSARYSPVLAESPVNAESIQVIIPCASPAGEPSAMGISANLVDSASGKSLQISMTRMDRLQKGPLEIIILAIPVAEIAPGAYYLHFRARDPASGSVGNTFTTLVIRRR